MKFASTQVSPVSTSANRGDPAPTYCPDLNDDAWETIPSEGIGAVALTVRGSRSVVSARGTGNKIPIGTEVLIKRVADAVATVEEVRQP